MITLEANYSKKIGLPGYSSHQFSVSLKSELSDVSQVEQESARLYAVLQNSVDNNIQQVGFLPGEAKPSTNGNPEHVNTKRVSYEEIVRFAFPTPPPGILMFVVTYYNGPKANPEGKLTAGHKVKVQNKMVFNVKATNRS